MEYSMLTLINSGKEFVPLVSVTSHELAHAWFQGVLATNEMKHEWMDEGSASYLESCRLCSGLIFTIVFLVHIIGISLLQIWKKCPSNKC